MFGKHLRLKRFLGGIVVTAAVAVVAVPSALSSTSSRGGTAGAAPDALARYVANHEAEQGRGTGSSPTRWAARGIPSRRSRSSPTGSPANNGTDRRRRRGDGYNRNAYVNGRPDA